MRGFRTEWEKVPSSTPLTAWGGWGEHSPPQASILKEFSLPLLEKKESFPLFLL